MKIYKYSVKRGITKLPKGSTVLHVGIQSEELYAWAIVPERSEGEYEAIYAFHTGDTCSEVNHHFRGTFLLNGGSYVLHVFVVPEIIHTHEGRGKYRPWHMGEVV